MRLRAFALTESAIYRWLENCLGEDALQEVASAEALRQQLKDGEAQLVFVQVEGLQREERLQLIRELKAAHGNITLVAVAGQADSSTILTAMRSGAQDFLLMGQDDDRIQELLAKAVQHGGERKVQNSNVVAILSGHADSGMAFLGQHLVLAMAETQRKNEAALLLDLGAPPGAAAVFMNIQTGYSALDAIADAYRCDTTLVDTAFGHHSKGPYVLSLPETLDGAPEVDANALRGFLDVASTLFSQIVICADRSLGEAPLHALADYAHHSLVICDQSILSSRHNQQMLRAMRQAEHAFEERTKFEWLIGQGDRVTLDKGEVLFRAGDEADAMFVVAEGELELVE